VDASQQHASTPSFSILGFGDRSFPRFCGFAAQVDAALEARGLRRLVRFSSVDRQSAGDFAEWGHLLGEQLGLPLSLSHVAKLPATRRLVLADRTLYGVEVQAPVAVLKLAAPQTRRTWLGGGLPHFEVGDLVGIIPPGSNIPRYYSLASSSRDGVLEICVRKQSGGLCSEFLHALSPGDTVDVFIRPNPAFRPARGRRPLILIGAGAGVAPLAGFVRHNRNRRPMHLFFGGRDPASDFLYREDLSKALDDGRLASLNTRFSRVIGGGYVQDLLIYEADALRDLVQQGAQIMVCGGRDMAEGVRAALDLCLAPVGLSAAALNQKELYLEDAY
jgi:sulfite reductase (NADPH) flavoprotein alpha-component